MACAAVALLLVSVDSSGSGLEYFGHGREGALMDSPTAGGSTAVDVDNITWALDKNLC